MSIKNCLYAVKPIKMVAIEKCCFLSAWVAQQKQLKLDTKRYAELTYDDFTELKSMLDDFIVNRDVNKKYTNDFSFSPFESDDGFWHSLIDIHTYASSVVESQRAEETIYLYRFSNYIQT